jgi:D-alanyl-lipoteichoic acid acyltransferase DltB (MBOAT superfamily)
MSFLSLQFVLFAGVALLAFDLAPARFRPRVLLAASYAFYLSWGPLHAIWLGLVTAIAYGAALGIARVRSERPKLALTLVAVSALVALLAAFKCAAALLEAAGQAGSAGRAALLLAAPLGISYYLFKVIGYLLDVYWEKIPAQRDFVAVALYASFFPQIVSGPIQRADDFFEQLRELDRPALATRAAGLRRVLFGLFKKLVLADRLAPVVDVVHAAPSTFSSLELLVGAYAFAFQLYADFSGVTDIALGLGQMFGIRGPENFELPFLSRNVQDFWRRWHISLSSWLSDYLFTPLRMNLRQLGTGGLVLALFVNMLAVGVWHAPTWTYAAFGALNGLFMIGSVLTLKRRNAFFKGRPRLARVRALAGPMVTFHLMVLAFIFFRASSIGSALAYVAHLIPGLHPAAEPATHVRWDLLLLGRKPSSLLVVGAGLAAAELLHWAVRQPRWSDRLLAIPRPFQWGAYYAVILTILLLGTLVTQKFIYAQF